MHELPPAIQQRIGLTRRRRVEVTARDIRRFAQAIGEPQQLPHEGPAEGLSAEAPALFCQALMYEDAEPEALPPDGTPLEIDLGLPNARTVGGSSDFHIERPVRAGDVIEVESTVRDIQVKEGRSGRLYLVSVETRFTDASLREVARELATYVQRS